MYDGAKELLDLQTDFDVQHTLLSFIPSLFLRLKSTPLERWSLGENVAKVHSIRSKLALDLSTGGDEAHPRLLEFATAQPRKTAKHLTVGSGPDASRR